MLSKELNNVVLLPSRRKIEKDRNFLEKQATFLKKTRLCIYLYKKIFYVLQII